jgi:hypothetical protein
MALVPRIRCTSYSELHIHSLENYLNYSASEPINVANCGFLSYLHGSDTEDSYV